MRKFILLLIFIIVGLLIGIFTISISINKYSTSVNNKNDVKEILQTGSILPEVEAKGFVHELTLSKIFDGILERPNDDFFELYVTGDIMQGRYVNVKTKESKNDAWAFADIKDFTSDPDKFVFGNLESPIVDNCKDKIDGMIFCVPEYAGKVLKDSGIDIVSLSNNHVLNYGVKGLESTIKYLDENGIKYTGIKNPTYITRNNIQIAFLGFNDIECNQNYIECVSEANIKEDIELASLNSDLVVVMFHWGSEYRHTPGQREKTFARFAIDNGADLVLGNHPHWYQSAEVYKSKLIEYSHGNFIFDQMWSQKTREGTIGKYVLTKDGLNDAEFIPIIINNYGQPKIYDEKNKQRILKHLESISLTP